MSSDMLPRAEPGETMFDIPSLLHYDGPNLRKAAPVPDGIVLLDYRNTDENERNIATLLSSQGIPFFIDRSEHGWTGTQMHMRVTVPSDRCREAAAVLAAAVKASAVDAIESDGSPRTR